MINISREEIKSNVKKYHNIILYGSYISFGTLILIIYKIFDSIYNNERYLFLYIIFFIMNLIFIYSRFIEKNLIFINRYKLNLGLDVKILVISDLHLGIYKGKDFLQRLVNKINNIEDIDLVIIPGDFVYYPYQDLNDMFSILSNVTYPIYGVLGNHDIDEESYTPNLKVNLIKALNHNKVNFLHNESTYIKDLNINILGLGDYLSNEDDVSLINKFDKSDNLIVITHNPDTVSKYINNITKLTISGHTHGGQIRLPFIYKKVIPCEAEFDQGLYDINNNKVFVSSGVGEVLLPMRLGIPPSIDVLDLK